MNSLGLTTFDIQMLGGLVMASHEATWEMESSVGSDLPFWKRLKNFYTMWYLIYKIHRHIYPLHQKIAEEHMGVPLPPMIDIARNTSLVFINEHPVMTYGSPKLPNIIRFYSLHVSDETKPLPQVYSSLERRAKVLEQLSSDSKFENERIYRIMKRVTNTFLLRRSYYFTCVVKL
ncbi:hypothetical protein K0M31_003041 [Melipona bicolor]|uniref:Uncharacterized protein n=1 Tax=Melipona bicolor TaxID=60889 RepID=A0AA40G0E1_9HYME|nr:hypothetical protein K0M31_003041 [Melipona bicolor]